MPNLIESIYKLTLSSGKIKDAVTCIDIVPPEDIKIGSQANIYVRPRNKSLPDKWPAKSIRLIDTYEVQGRESFDIVLDLENNSQISLNRNPMIGEIFHLTTTYTKEIHESLEKEAFRRSKDAGKPFH